MAKIAGYRFQRGVVWKLAAAVQSACATQALGKV